jgi:glycosyltransferase involved in cell wall biosynthesis
MKKLKLGIWGDAVTPTGFSRVLHSIVKYLPDNYDIFWLGINYTGDPHPYKRAKIYPAITYRNPGDVYGISRIEDIVNLEKPDVLFLLFDAWVLNGLLGRLKEIYKGKTLPKIVTYIPIDAMHHDPDWYVNFDIVSTIVAYTNFGKSVLQKVLPGRDIEIVPHGVDSTVFYKMEGTKQEIKRKLYKDKKDDFYDGFIVLNAGRNQPRKRLDITLQAFALFSRNKPNNVKLYMHCGVQDSHINISKLAVRYGISNRLILTNNQSGIQMVPDKHLNLIYNATDVGINTGLGEGWGLPNCEHTLTGAPQVVAGHSALFELYEDCGILVPVEDTHVIDGIMTTGYIVNPADVAEKLDEIYSDKDNYDSLSRKGIEKFSDDKYKWQNIALIWDEIFRRGE